MVTRQVEFSLFLVRARVKLQAGAMGNKINLAAKTNAHSTGMTIVAEANRTPNNKSLMWAVAEFNRCDGLLTSWQNMDAWFFSFVAYSTSCDRRVPAHVTSGLGMIEGCSHILVNSKSIGTASILTHSLALKQHLFVAPSRGLGLRPSQHFWT